MTISTDQMLKALENVCQTVEKEKDYLSELDGAIGDGDHGVNMAKCFRAVRKKLSESQEENFEEILRGVGMVVLNAVGGAMGALYGTFFLKLAQGSAGKKVLELGDLVKMFQTAEKGILELGKAKLGDKTLIDTLSPAVRSLENSEKEGKALPEALLDFVNAARQGMESTKDLIAKMGRASRLGERTIGHQDAGATSCYFILKSMSEGFVGSV